MNFEAYYDWLNVAPDDIVESSSLDGVFVRARLLILTASRGHFYPGHRAACWDHPGSKGEKELRPRATERLIRC